MAFVLPTRKAFADYIARIYLKYRADPSADDEGVDLCLQQTSSKTTRELLPYQKLVRDYLLLESPYRGLLVYHGLGSGKTCSAIGVAESLLSTKKVFILLPASLQSNFRQEIRKCGDPVYTQNNFWETRTLRSEADKQPALAMGISDEFLKSQGRYFITVPNQPSNYNTLPLDTRKGIDAQIEDLIDSRYNFINYNGLNGTSVKALIPEDDPKESKTFENSVVIIDEAHNLISRAINKSDIGRRIYDAIYYAKDCKVVALSGTPLINRPNEIAFLLNLLRGPIERLMIPVKELPTWDEAGMKTYFKAIPEVDTVEFNSVKRLIMITRNPTHFKSIYNEAGDRIAVKYDESVTSKTAGDWVDGLRKSFADKFPGGVLAAREYIQKEALECLPTDFSEFVNTFIDGLDVKNALLFQKRIQGLVSYYKGSDERMLPKRTDDDKMIEKIEMSDEQFNRYLEMRHKEIQMDSRKSAKGPSALNQDFSTYRVMSRLVCNYAVPSALRGTTEETNEDTAGADDDKAAVLEKLRLEPDKYLRSEGLKSYSPKMLKMLANIKETGNVNQLIYSNYRKLEGLGIISAILDANGYQPYRIVKIDGKYVEDPTLDPKKPAYAFYTGEEKKEIKEIMLHIFNEDYRTLQSVYPEHVQSMKESILKRGGEKLLCVLMITASGAEGINLKNVRRIHISEPHWNPARTDQVMGRGIRLCSHATRQTLSAGGTVNVEVVPVEERTIRISYYISVFTDAQAKSSTGFNIVSTRRADTAPRKYDMKEAGRAPEAFMTSDEFLYEISYEKERITSGITRLIKQAAVDCEIHRKLHGREKPLLQCLRFDSSVKAEDLASNPDIKKDERDASYLRNTMKRSRRLQRIKVKEFVFLYDPETHEVFDNSAFGDNERLLKLGMMKTNKIEFFTYE
jgi:Type III restriction enzyme, res subunit/Helicase conserved C-terminal domain